jgi:ATP-dependent DNA helicase RecQ
MLMPTPEAAALLAEAQALADCPPEQIARRLIELRQLYREQPALFGHPTQALLRAAAERVSAAKAQAQSARALTVLAEVFGYPSFRAGQLEIIEEILAGRDCVGVMPTGAGKSVTYQIPARLLGGITLVVSPLISLMKDQVDAMREVGIRATFLNSSLEAEDRAERIAGLRRGDYELLYAAPEGIDGAVGRLLGSLDLRLIAVDEAHCISEWGHDFRPAYRNLSGLKERFGGLPVLALTATATERVKNDIIGQLALREPHVVRGSFYRQNLRLYAVKKGQSHGTGQGVREMILALVRARRGEPGIVYCLSRKSADSTAEFLVSKGIRAAAYHGGMRPEARAQTQDRFIRDDVEVVCATIAFGMGIDKSNVRFVIHRDMPRSIEGYYQEIGRAGRDGAASDCILFYSWADVLSLEAMSERSEAEDPDVVNQARLAVRRMYDLADAGECLWRRLAEHFDEEIANCGASCGLCNGLDIIRLAAAVRVPARRPIRAHESGAVVDTATTDAACTAATDGDLFDRLRQLRKTLADQRGVPAYVIFSDRTLADMAARRPRSGAALLEVHGVGNAKLMQYGDAFLEEIGRSQR